MDIDPGTYHLRVRQGRTLRRVFTVTNGGSLIDLTGWTARAQVRAEVEAATVVVDLTMANGGVVLGGPAGTITLVKSAAETAALPAGFGVWDLEVVEPDGEVSVLLQGQASILPEVTR